MSFPSTFRESPSPPPWPLSHQRSCHFQAAAADPNQSQSITWRKFLQQPKTEGIILQNRRSGALSSVCWLQQHSSHCSGNAPCFDCRSTRKWSMLHVRCHTEGDCGMLDLWMHEMLIHAKFSWLFSKPVAMSEPAVSQAVVLLSEHLQKINPWDPNDVYPALLLSKIWDPQQKSTKWKVISVACSYRDPKLNNCRNNQDRVNKEWWWWQCIQWYLCQKGSNIQ